MKRTIDPDLKALKKCVDALLTCTSERMLKANMEFLIDTFTRNPSPSLPPHLLPERMRKEREKKLSPEPPGDSEFIEAEVTEG